MSENYVAKYIRVSDDDNDIGNEKKESNSITNQRRLLDDFIMKETDLSKYPVREFVDDGISGVTFRRPGVQSMLNEVRNNKIICIVVKDLSRFGRNYIEVGDYIEQIFPFLGVRFISVADNYDSAKKVAGLEIGFKNLIHDLYSRDLSQKVKTVKALKQEKGLYPGGDVPYGYVRKEDIPYVQDPKAAEIVRRIFYLAAEGNTTTKIAEWLNKEGVLVPGEYKNSCTSNHYQLKNEKRRLWSASQVGLIIQNEVYLGTFVGRKLTTVRPRKSKKNDKSEYIRIKGHHEQLIDEQLFQKAQAVIKTCKKRGNYKKEENLSFLKGKVKCGCCGYGMSIKHTKKRDYFYCRMGDSCGSRMHVEKDVLEETVRSILVKLAEIDQEKEKEYQTNRVQILGIVAKLKEQKRILEINADHCKTNRLELYHQWKDGDLETKEYILRKDELLQKERDYLAEIDSIRKKLISKNAGLETGIKKNRFSAFIEDFELKKNLVDELIERIEVYSDNQIEIYWKFEI